MIVLFRRKKKEHDELDKQLGHVEDRVQELERRMDLHEKLLQKQAEVFKRSYAA